MICHGRYGLLYKCYGHELCMDRREKAGGDLVLTRFKKEPTHLIQEPSSTPQQYQQESYEVYDLTKFASGISVSPEDTGVQHVFHVMEKDAVASMVLAADTASDAER